MRKYSLAAVERFLELKPRRCSVQRNKRGRILALQFFPLPNTAALEGMESLRKSAHMGQHYSFESQVDEAGHKAWQFSEILIPRDDMPGRAAYEAELQRIFRAVQLSCITKYEAAHHSDPARLEDSDDQNKAGA